MLKTEVGTSMKGSFLAAPAGILMLLLYGFYASGVIVIYSYCRGFNCVVSATLLARSHNALRSFGMILLFKYERGWCVGYGVFLLGWEHSRML